MRIRDIKRWLAPLRNTPLHPQWLIGQSLSARDLENFSGIVADIGCADRAQRHNLPRTVQYIGLDYYQTAVNWYESRPDVFGDARQLPFADASLDGALMLHVLEHIDRPDQALDELVRVLRPGGRALIEVPFLYPIHDAPFDFRRWTAEGLRVEAISRGLSIETSSMSGRASETAALLFNLALSRLILDWIRRRHLLLALAPLLALLIPVFNLLGWALGPLYRSSDFMPHRAQVHCRKPGLNIDG